MSDALSESDDIFKYILACDHQNVTQLLRRNPAAIRARTISFEGKEMVASPLQFANSTQMLDTLLTNGADIDEVSFNGTALNFAGLARLRW